MIARCIVQKMEKVLFKCAVLFTFFDFFDLPKLTEFICVSNSFRKLDKLETIGIDDSVCHIDIPNLKTFLHPDSFIDIKEFKYKSSINRTFWLDASLLEQLAYACLLNETNGIESINNNFTYLRSVEIDPRLR